MILDGASVVLEPLETTHEAALIEAASDGELWNLWFTRIPAPDTAAAYINKALETREHSGAMPFVVRDKLTNEIVGSTRYCNVDEVHQRLEIGYTWYAKRAQRTMINTECKLLLLTHAFEQLSAIAVEFRTHWHNLVSREAISRLGAKQDGVLRNHQKNPGGGYRDTVVFSIIESEWPSVKQSLKFRLERS